MEEANNEHFEKMAQAEATTEAMVPESYERADLLPFSWAEGDFEVEAMYLGNYEPWNQREQVDIIMRELGWKHASIEGTYVDWDKVDCPFEIAYYDDDPKFSGLRKAKERIVDTIVERRIEPNRLLEIGEANGYVLDALQREFDYEAFEVEPSILAVEDGKGRFPNVDFRQGVQ